MKIMFSILIGMGLIGFLFLKYYPIFGGKSSQEKINEFKKSPNFRHNKFINQIPTSTSMNMKTLFTVLRDFIKGNPRRSPDKKIPIVSIDPSSLEDQEHTKVMWLGHSTILLVMDGKKILLDPMFSNSASPFPIFPAKRFNEKLPIEIEALPHIDIVLLSHDHYDHLDYVSIQKLKGKVSQFCVPLGVGSHLEKWGIEQERITELDWWQETEVLGLRLVTTPTRHFSGRSLFDRNTTLWCSWVLIGKQSKIYCSGDGGYGPHFKEIGEKYGPFPLTLMECGQYDPRWSAIHMMPEETVQAHIDLQGKRMLPIHWAAFSLAIHDWKDSIERVTRRAKEKNIEITTPRIGEPVNVEEISYPNDRWWKNL